MRGELRQQATGGVQLRSVGSGVDDHHHGVETGTRDVVGEAVAGAVGRVVMGREDQTAAYRVAGVVDGENGGTRGGRVPHLGVGVVLEGRAEPERCVHQLLEAEDQYTAGVAVQGVGDAGGHGGKGRFQGRAVCGGEAVPAAVGHPGRPPQLHSGAGAVGLSPGYRRSGPGRSSRAAAVACLGGPLMGGYQRLSLLQDAVREADRARSPRHQVDACADLRGELGQASAVGRRPHVHQGHDHVPVARAQLVQRADRVEHGVARGELVVHQHERLSRPPALTAGPEQRRVLRQQ